MDDAQATLLLTRPRAQSDLFLADCEAALDRRLPVVISPLIEIDPVGDIPDLGHFRTIVLSSGNGVRRLGRMLAKRKRSSRD